MILGIVNEYGKAGRNPTPHENQQGTTGLLKSLTEHSLPNNTSKPKAFSRKVSVGSSVLSNPISTNPILTNINSNSVLDYIQPPPPTIACGDATMRYQRAVNSFKPTSGLAKILSFKYRSFLFHRRKWSCYWASLFSLYGLYFALVLAEVEISYSELVFKIPYFVVENCVVTENYVEMTFFGLLTVFVKNRV